MEEVTLDAVRVDAFLDNEYPSASKVAAWVDVEGFSYGVLQSMEGAADRIKLLHVEVETTEIWPRQKLESDVVALAGRMGFDMVARGPGDLQRDVIFVNKDWYAANRKSILNILGLSRLIGPTASRIVGAGCWQALVGPVLGRIFK